MGRDFGRAGASGTRAAALRADDAGAARPWLSVVVVTRGPSLVLARLLRSIGRVNTPAAAEVLIGLNGSNRVEATRRLVHRYAGSTRARVESLACAPPAVVRNKLAEKAAAPFLLFVDDDVELPPEFLEEVQVIAREGRVAVAGGPNLTPPASNEFEQLTGRVLGSMFATG